MLLSNVLAHFIFYFLGKSWCLVPLSFLFPLSLFQLLFKWKESGRFRKNGKVLGSNYPTIYPGTVFLHQITALPANDYSHYSCPSWQGLAACNNAYEEPKKQPSDSFNESFAYVAHNEIVCETAVSNQISAFNSPNTDAKDPPPLYPSIPDNTDLGYIDPKC